MQVDVLLRQILSAKVHGGFVRKNHLFAHIWLSMTMRPSGAGRAAISKP